MFDYDLNIANEKDPLVQMKASSTREKVIINKALKEHNSVTFNTLMEIEFAKNVGEEIYITLSHLCRN